MFAEYKLNGASYHELNTEIRFLTASAAVDKMALFCLKLSDNRAESSAEKIKSNVVKVLRTLKKEGIIEFFVTREGFGNESTESVFLTNKYGDFINLKEESELIYVKL